MQGTTLSAYSIADPLLHLISNLQLFDAHDKLIDAQDNGRSSRFRDTLADMFARFESLYCGEGVLGYQHVLVSAYILLQRLQMSQAFVDYMKIEILNLPISYSITQKRAHKLYFSMTFFIVCELTVLFWDDDYNAPGHQTYFESIAIQYLMGRNKSYRRLYRHHKRLIIKALDYQLNSYVCGYEGAVFKKVCAELDDLNNDDIQEEKVDAMDVY